MNGWPEFTNTGRKVLKIDNPGQLIISSYLNKINYYFRPGMTLTIRAYNGSNFNLKRLALSHNAIVYLWDDISGAIAFELLCLLSYHGAVVVLPGENVMLFALSA